jgi:hypothetical protein
MLKGDLTWPVRAVHVAGLALLLAFAIAFALSAFAAKPRTAVAGTSPSAHAYTLTTPPVRPLHHVRARGPFQSAQQDLGTVEDVGRSHP